MSAAAATMARVPLAVPDLPEGVSALDAARAYLAAGFHVVALHGLVDGRCTCGKEHKSPGKHPVAAGWKGMAPAATLAHLSTGPRNIGLAMGGPARLVALDVDGAEGAAQLAAFESEHGPLPPTATQRTGSGGEHRLFTCPPHLDMGALSNRVGLRGRHDAGGLDVRTDGGQVVVAPSSHASGQPYQWTRTGPVADLPDALFSLIAGPPREPAPVPANLANLPSPSGSTFGPTAARPDVVARARRYLATMPPAVQGQAGSKALLGAAFALVHGFDLPASTAEALLWSEYNPRCVPPWRRDEPDGPAHKVASVPRTRRALEVPRGYLLTAEGERKHPPRAPAAAPSAPHPPAEAHGWDAAVSVLGSGPVESWLIEQGVDPEGVDLYRLARASGVHLLAPLVGVDGEPAGVLAFNTASGRFEVGQGGHLACDVARSMLLGACYNDAGRLVAPWWVWPGTWPLDVTICGDLVGYLRAAASVGDANDTPPATLATLGAWPADLASRLPRGCHVTLCGAPDAALDDLLPLAATSYLTLTVE